MGRRYRQKKATAQLYHSMMRVDERRNPEIPLVPIVAIASMTTAVRYQDRREYKGKVVFYERQSNRVTKFHVLHEGQWFPVVYDKIRKTIITILPKGAFGPDPEVTSSSKE